MQASLPAALDRLPAGDRSLLELSLRHGVPDGEVATLLNLDVREVRIRREGVLKRLAAEVGIDGPGGVDALRAALEGPDADGWNRRATVLEEPTDPEVVAERSAFAPSVARRAPAWLLQAPNVALLLLPGALTVYLGFHAGGFFAGGTAAAAVLLCVALLLRVTLADHPFAGLSRLGVIALMLLALFTGWTLLSEAWSDAPARALIEADRALLYFLACLLFTTVPRSARNLQVVLWGVAAAAILICFVGLASRVLPELVSAGSNGVNGDRLAYPITYWNALGLLAALGIIACFHLCASEREPAPARVLAAGAVPALAVALYFTFSRGAIAVGAVALLVYVVLAHPRGLPAALLALLPPTVFALTVAYDADMLATGPPTGASAAAQADEVALVTGLAMAAAALLRALLVPVDARIARVRLGARTRRVLTATIATVLLLGCAGAALALDAPRKLERQYDRFLDDAEVEGADDARKRLTDPGNNGRLDHWGVSLDAFERDRVKGIGAGRYEQEWARERPVQFAVIDAHSLYLETLAELGVVGLALLVGVFLTLLVSLVRRIRGPDRALHAALLAMVLAWLAHAGIDWDWEMPVVSLWLFAIAGASLARPEGARPRLGRPARPLRVGLGLLALLFAVVPVSIYISQQRLDRAVQSFERGDCPAAIDHALDSNSALAIRPEPFEVLAYCDVRLGRTGLALRAMEEALERDPRAWQLQYGMALVRAAAGRDPRPAARRALRLNPRDPLARRAVRLFRTDDPRKWRRRALGARLPIE